MVPRSQLQKASCAPTRIMDGAFLIQSRVMTNGARAMWVSMATSVSTRCALVWEWCYTRVAVTERAQGMVNVTQALACVSLAKNHFTMAPRTVASSTIAQSLRMVLWMRSAAIMVSAIRSGGSATANMNGQAPVARTRSVPTVTVFYTRSSLRTPVMDEVHAVRTLVHAPVGRPILVRHVNFLSVQEIAQAEVPATRMKGSVIAKKDTTGPHVSLYHAQMTAVVVVNATASLGSASARWAFLVTVAESPPDAVPTVATVMQSMALTGTPFGTNPDGSPVLLGRLFMLCGVQSVMHSLAWTRARVLPLAKGRAHRRRRSKYATATTHSIGTLPWTRRVGRSVKLTTL